MTRALRTPHGPPPQHAESESVRGRDLVLLWAGQFVNTAGLMMLVPIMPFYLRQIGTSSLAETQTWAGVAIAAPALALTVATPLWGRLGDRIGRKWMVVRALLGLAIAMIVMATASSPLLLVAGRLLQGTLGGVVEAAAAFAGSTGSDQKRGSALGKSFSATAAGALAGPVAGGLFVGAGGLQQLMLVIAGVAAMLAVTCGVGLREPARSRPLTGSGETTTRQRRRPSVREVPGAGALALAAIAAYFGVYGLIPVYAEHVEGVVTDQGGASLWVGVLHSVMWGATLLGSFWWGKHNDLTGRPLRTFVLSAGGCAAAIAVIALPLDPYAMIPLRLVQGFCFAALAQSLFLHFSKHAPADRRSAFVSTANSYLLIGQSAGPLLAGPLVGLMPVPGAVLVMAGACALGCLLALTPSSEEKRSPEEHPDDVSAAGEVEPTRPIPVVASARNGVAIAPFRGWRITQRNHSTLAGRYATPWSELPHPGFGILADWQRSGAIIQDRRPALYAYEQLGPHGTIRGVVALVHLDSGLLPHADVIPEHVQRLTNVMERQRANLDPALLGFSGDGRTATCIDDAAHHPPVAEVLAHDGQTHRLWPITDHVEQDQIIAELEARAAFIADGHHRHAAARQYRRAAYAAGQGQGPWDYFPALLVDVTKTPMSLAPVHRVLPRLDPREALQMASARFRVTPMHGEITDWITKLKRHSKNGPAYVLATPRGGYLLTEPQPRFLNAALDGTASALRTMNVAILDTALLDRLWQIPNRPGDINYEPNPSAALRMARDSGGVAVLTNPPTRRDLKAAAASGIRLPHKSTSFGPKPHPGLVFRTLDDR
ncbi:MFS transporter [Saccharopolyspora sp. TS4A08]|uniref:MFS transporter n=1 Tax=Saccharopolyspora ipomoeae TaxID=3042027 RepID=A0ABT6PLL9_9PSEU|nr:MFS transporter [Saccharopolyspora sp. TS4A08]MDI2028891.1 MFS transporter [Saccharopolyspora sp. TS4A08]